MEEPVHTAFVCFWALFGPAVDWLSDEFRRRGGKKRAPHSTSHCQLDTTSSAYACREAADPRAIPTQHQPVAVVLDFVNPERAGRRLGDLGRTAGLDEAGWARHLTCAHSCLREIRPDLCARLTADRASEIRFDVRQPDMVWPAVRADRDAVAASVVAAVDQHVANAGFAHLAEGDLLRMAGHDIPELELAALYLGTLCFRTTIAGLVHELGWRGTKLSHPVHGIAPSLAAPVLPDWGRTVFDSWADGEPSIIRKAKGQEPATSGV